MVLIGQVGEGGRHQRREPDAGMGGSPSRSQEEAGARRRQVSPAGAGPSPSRAPEETGEGAGRAGGGRRCGAGVAPARDVSGAAAVLEGGFLGSLARRCLRAGVVRVIGRLTVNVRVGCPRCASCWRPWACARVRPSVPPRRRRQGATVRWPYPCLLCRRGAWDCERLGHHGVLSYAGTLWECGAQWLQFPGVDQNASYGGGMREG